MPYPLPLTRTEAYLAYKAGVIQQSDLKPSLSIPRNGIDAWLAYWTGLANYYPIKNLGKNIIDYAGHLNAGNHDGLDVSLDDATGQITVSGQPTRGYAKIVNTYDITNLLEDGKEYTISQSAYDNKLYAQVNAIPTTGTPTYIYSTSSAKTFTVDKTTYPRYNLVIQTGAQSAWTEPQTITRTFQIEKGSSASAFEPYTGEPLTLQEEEAYIAYLCGVINEYPEKCLRRVGAYLRYIISARWGRPDHPLNREELYLSLIKTQFIPSGDPSSDIEIDGTAKAAFQDVKMYGDTFQQTYSGKNLFDRENYGTLLGWAAQGEIKNYGNRVFYIQCKPGTTYTIQKMLAKPVERSRCQIFTTSDVPAVGVSVIGVLFSTKDATQATVTTQSSANYLCIACYEAVASTETTVQEMADSIMIEEGATASPYEPYVGLQPSPNPDYPQPVQTVTGLQTVTVSGKNIFDGQLEIGGWTINTGQTCEYATNNNAYRCINPIPVKPSSTYSLSVNGSRFDGFRAIFCDSNMTVLSSVVVNNTIVTPASCAYITFYSSAIKTQFPSLSDIKTSQIEKGSAVTIYEPYSSNDYEINLGKNLYVPAFTNPNVTLTEDGFEMTTSQNNTNPSWSAFATLELKLNPWTEYTLSKKSYVVEGNEYNHSGGLRTYIEGVYSGEKDEDSITFTTGVSGVVDLLFYTGYLDTTQGEIYTKVRFENVQIEAGPNATSYAPHFEPIELCKLGTYQDYIWKDGEDWKVHKSTGKTAFTGDASEGWFRSGNTSETVFCAAKNINALTIPAALSVRQLSKMDRFTWHNTSPYGIGNFDVYNQSGNYANNILLSFDITKVADITAATTWISDNNPTLYYPIYTATDTTITNQALIDQLEALVAGGAEEGTTYIKVSASDPNLPGLLVVEAPKYE